MHLTTTQKRQTMLGAILLAYVAFISLGLPDGLLGVAWPSVRAHFSQPLDALGELLLASMLGYTTSSFISGKVIARLGVGGVLALSCALTGLSVIGYTLAPFWWLFLAIGVLAGLGAGAIDAGINTYIASEHGEGLMQWLHASYGIGVTLGPIIMTAGLNYFADWRWGYHVVGLIQLGLAVCFALTTSLWKRRKTDDKPDSEAHLLDYHTPMRETLVNPRTWLSLLLFFVYTGIELTLGDWAYTLLTEGRGIAPAIAGLLAGSYWAMFTIGRILAGLYTRRINGYTLLRGSMIAAAVGGILLWWNPSAGVSLVGVVIVGFAIAPIFPGLVSGTRDRVGPRHAANTIGMQISCGGLGGTLLPGLAGVLAKHISLEIIPIFLVILILALLGLYMFSMWGRIRPKPEAQSAQG